MTTESSIENLVGRLVDALRAVLPDPPDDVRERLRPIVESVVEQAQLVPREEFERQLALLRRLEEQAARLEARVRTLEGVDHSGGDARL
jgi:BMFP domain-containing protein YqiC